jgi:hypothetical protein
MVLNDRVYNALKWLCVLVLPALATLIRVVFAIWNIPYGEQISATIVALNAFLGACLGVSNIQYKANKELGE